MSAGADAAGVQVFLRLRPTTERSDIELFDYQPSTRPDAITIKDPLSSGRCTHSYEFSGILGPADGQERVFSVAAAPAVEAALRGRSSCVLAYGQTGSGKTFSVFGEGGSKRGMLPRAMERLFQAGASRAAGGSAAGIAVSFLEVYLDQVYDLTGVAAEGGSGDAAQRRPSLPPPDAPGSASAPALRHTATFPLPKAQGSKSSAAGASTAGAAARPPAPGSAARGLEIHETANGRVFVQGLSRTPAYSMADVHRIMELGFAARKTAATAANQRSSRSHTIFTVHLPAPGNPTPADSQELSQGPLEDLGNEVTLSFVDLAGSERLAKTKAEGERFREAVAINTSLTALGKVVLALATAERHVPYRDSKLTRILSGSLAGGAQVSLLATVHPRVEDYEESLNTLSFAHKCTSITRPQVTFATQKSAEIRLSELQAEAAELRALLTRSGGHQQAQGLPPWGAGLVGQELPPLPVDTLNEAIDSIVAAATQGAPEGGRGLGGQSALEATMDPAVRSLAELREQRRCQAQCQAKAERRAKEAQAAREEIGEQKACRMREAEGLRHRRKALAAELECLKVELSAARAEQAAGHGAACRRAQLEADDRAERVNRALQETNRNVALCEEAVEVRRGRFEEERQQLGLRHVEVVRALKQQHSAQLEELEAHWRARLASQDQRNRELALELPAARERERASTARCQAELLSLGELVARLAGLVAEVEDGLHPIMRQGGVKAAMLPGGAIPPQPTRDTHPVLFDATASAEELVAALERAGGRVLQPRTRLLSKAARGGIEGAEQLAAEASRSRPASAVARGGGAPRRIGGGPAAAAAAEPLASAEAPRPGAETPGFGASLRSEAAGALAEAAGGAEPAALGGAEEQEEVGWDAAALARDVVEAEADARAEELLAGLPSERLRQLCAKLRERALEIFDPVAEREAIRRDLAQGLAGDATQQYVRQLERRRDEARAECNAAAERERRLRSELELRRAALSGSIPPRPCSAASSAGSAMGGHRSRSLSRRHFGLPAGGAKPPSAASTRAPSRGTACPSLPSATSRRGRPGTACTAGGTRPSTACAQAATGAH